MYRYVGYFIALLFCLLSFTSFVIGVYMSVKMLYKNNLKFDEKPLLTSRFYTLLSIFFIFISLLTFITIEIGFSWEIIIVSILLFSLLFFLIGVDYSINKWAMDFLSKRKTSFIAILKDNPIIKIIKGKDTNNKKDE